MPSKDALEEHAKQTPACEPRPRNPIIGISDEIWREYKNAEAKKWRGKRVSRDLVTDGARWKLLYEVVFPNEGPTPSPCSSSLGIPDQND